MLLQFEYFYGNEADDLYSIAYQRRLLHHHILKICPMEQKCFTDFYLTGLVFP